MFGNKDRLVEQLGEEGGVVSWATVLDAKTRWTSGTNYENGPYTVGNRQHMTVKLRVEPENEPPFEVKLKQTFARKVAEEFRAQVIYDPADHSRIAVLEDKIVAPWMTPEQAERSQEHRRRVREASEQGRTAAYLQEDIAAKIAAAQKLAEEATGKLIVNGQMLGANAGPPDVTEQLTKLADLRDRGALTEAEFEAEKAKLLAGS